MKSHQKIVNSPSKQWQGIRVPVTSALWTTCVVVCSGARQSKGILRAAAVGGFLSGYSGRGLMTGLIKGLPI